MIFGLRGSGSPLKSLWSTVIDTARLGTFKPFSLVIFSTQCLHPHAYQLVHHIQSFEHPFVKLILLF